MDMWGISHVVTANIMDTGAMVRARLAKAGDIGGAEKTTLVESLRIDMQERVQKFNEWACDLGRRDPRFVPYVMVDPVLFDGSLIDKLAGWIERGARGAKVHPNICGHYPDDARMHPIYELLSAKGLVVLTDSTAKPDHKGGFPGAPINWAPVLRRFPKLKLQIAHLPGGRFDERIALAQEFHGDLWFDTSQGFVDAEHPPLEHRQLTVSDAVRVLKKIGIERILFASDSPGGDAEVNEQALQILRLALTDGEKEAILSGNAKKLLGLS
jgi:predicted TIM-barrel fold metal-dependent hydrolase